MVGKLAEIISKGSFLASDELKADRIGLTYAIEAGYDAHGAERALTLLGTKQRKQRILPSGHKSPVVRLDLLKAQIAEAKPGKIGEVRYDTEAVQRVEAALVAATAPAAPAEPAVSPAPAPTPAPAPAPAPAPEDAAAETPPQ